MIIPEGVLISIGVWFGKKVADFFISQFKKTKTDFDIIKKQFLDTLEKVSDDFQTEHPDLMGGSIDYFFKDEKVFEELLKMLFKNKEVNLEAIKQKFHVESLPPQFIEEYILRLKSELSKHFEINELFSSKELYYAVFSITENIESIKESTKETSKALGSMGKLLKENFIEFDFDKFMKIYRKNAINNLSEINFFGLGISSHIKKSRKKLQDIYVKPMFETIYNKSNLLNSTELIAQYKLEFDGERDQLMSYCNIFDELKHKVILGNPGSGKSLFSKAVMCAILQNKRQEFANPLVYEYLPLRIELRKYLMLKKEKNYNHIKTLLHILETEFTITGINEHCIENLLDNKKILFFFDGLDEIFDIKDKLEVKHDIENIVSTYDNILGVVTSRIIGYEEAKLNDNFEELRIQDFEEEQIIEYIQKWYRIEEPDRKKREIDQTLLIDQMDTIDSELISNPLLLSLIVILYRNNNKLPDSKLEIYKSCTKTLVDKWEATKELKINLEESLINKKEIIFSDLAFWQYEKLSNKDKGVTISNSQVLATVINTIINKLKITDDAVLAEKWAEDFLNYAEKRSLYFDNNFTHKTFLEYYTAFYVYTNYERKGQFAERNELISKYIVNSYWFVVLELLFDFIDEDQADSQVVDELVTFQLQNTEACNFLLNAIKNLKNISKAQIHKVIEIAISHVLTASDLKSVSINIEETDKVSVLKEISSKLQMHLYDDSYKDICMKIILNFRNVISNETDLIKYYIFIFEIVILKLFLSNTEKIDVLNLIPDLKELADMSTKNEYLYRLQSIDDKYNFSSFLEYLRLFGASSAFESKSGLFIAVGLGPYISSFFYYAIDDSDMNTLEEDLQALSKWNLSVQMLSKYLVDMQLYFYTHESKLESKLLKILQKMSIVNDREISMLLAIVVVNSLIRGNKYGFVEVLKSQILTISKSVQFTEIVNVIFDFSITNYDEKLNRILYLLGFDKSYLSGVEF